MEARENRCQGSSRLNYGRVSRLLLSGSHPRVARAWRTCRMGKEVTLTPGQTFYEGPDDVHVVGRNASSTKPAKFLVFLVKDQGAPVLVPVPE